MLSIDFSCQKTMSLSMNMLVMRENRHIDFAGVLHECDKGGCGCITSGSGRRVL